MEETNTLTSSFTIFLIGEKKIMVEFYSFENQIAIIFMKPIKVRTLLKVKKMVGIIMKYEELSLKEAMKESKLSKNYISLVY